MYQFLETIKCLNGELINLDYHQSRFNLARKAFFRPGGIIRLKDTIQIPGECSTGLYRCRVTYSQAIDKTEFLPYQHRSIGSLKLVEDDKVDYRYKYTDRSHLERLYALRGACDDILIVKNGFISDSFTSNVLFYDGRKWWTPETPLLCGTQRARLIHEKKVHVCSITPSDLHKYQKAGLINAMLDMSDMPVMEINRIEGI